MLQAVLIPFKALIHVFDDRFMFPTPTIIIDQRTTKADRPPHRHGPPDSCLPKEFRKQNCGRDTAQPKREQSIEHREYGCSGTAQHTVHHKHRIEYDIGRIDHNQAFIPHLDHLAVGRKPFENMMSKSDQDSI